MNPGSGDHDTPLCVVVMPAGRRQDATGATVDFDAVFSDLVAPAVERAGMQPVRTDTAGTGDAGEAPVDARIVLCDHAVADLSSADPLVCYQVGLRHGLRPGTTVLICGAGWRAPIGAGGSQVVSYGIADGLPADTDAGIEAIAAALGASRAGGEVPVFDTAFYDLVDGAATSEISRLKTDVFRDRVHYAEDVKLRLADARAGGADAVRLVDAELGDLAQVESAVVVDLMLSYRAVGAWQDVVDLVDRMTPALRGATMVREQLALALNRTGHGEEAEACLRSLLAERGGSGETWALLGRVYKDRWQAAVDAGDRAAREILGQAIDAYVAGFEADWRDAYPGINAVTLMELAEPPDERRHALLPVVRYAVERRLAQGTPDYWDHATLIELAVLAGDEAAARRSLGRALACAREPWEPESTARNLRLIAASRDGRDGRLDWAASVESALRDAQARMTDLR